jgi:hypothetical protein
MSPGSIGENLDNTLSINRLTYRNVRNERMNGLYIGRNLIGDFQKGASQLIKSSLHGYLDDE